ncbi:MAG: hypothetical protein ACOCS7_02530 [Halolamina sp.]
MAERNYVGSDTPQARAAQSNQIWEARQRARHDVVDQFETIDDPQDVALERRDEAFAPARSFLEWAEPREMAHHYDPEFPRQDLGPEDVERVDDGWRPREDVFRREAAYELDEEFPDVDLGPGDVERVDDGWGLTGGAEREIAAAEFEDETPLEEVDPEDDIRRTDDGFELRDRVIEENRRLFY